MILSPDKAALSGYRRVVDAMAARLLPPGIQGEKHIQVAEERGLLVAVLGGRDQAITRGYDILAGVTLTKPEQIPWWHLDGPVPDGSFAIFRTDDTAMEAVTDYTGSKTIWYARLQCGGVVASTCMEMIVALLGDFSVDDRALGWFLSSGTCGPRRSWDRRIKPLAPNSHLIARINAATVTASELSFGPRPQRFDHVDDVCLENELRQSVSQSDFGDKPWLLALSGGYDSRAILFGTRHIKDLTCVTWADEFLVDQPNSDLSVARLLAEKTGRRHVVKVIKRPQDAAALDQALRRFVRYCDGRVDNYLAYVDGMQIWDELCMSEAGGFLRGDELFGSSIAIKTAQILQNMRLNSFANYAPSRAQQELAIRHDHSTPADYLKQPGESAARWRWRLRADYEIPTVYAALNSIRARFGEVSCPLLAGNLVSIAASMRSKDLDDKRLFNQVVSGMFPGIPFAANSSILRRSDVLAIPQAAELVVDHMSSVFAHDVLGARCAKMIGDELTRLGNNRSAKTNKHDVVATGKSRTPRWIKQVKRRFDPAPQLHAPTLGMRSYMAKLTQEEMTKTAKLGARIRNHVKHVTA